MYYLKHYDKDGQAFWQEVEETDKEKIEAIEYYTKISKIYLEKPHSNQEWADRNYSKIKFLIVKLFNTTVFKKDEDIILDIEYPEEKVQKYWANYWKQKEVEDAKIDK